MKHQRPISILSCMIAGLALLAAICGLLPGQGVGYEFQSLHGQMVSIYGRGLYGSDSVSMATQAMGQDIITIFLGVPLLLISLHLARKGLMKGKLFLTGALGYFLYTYTSYSFCSMYNSFFLIDVVLMSMSFFAFTLSMMSFDMAELTHCFSKKLPVKLIGGLLIFIASLLCLMWLKMILTPLLAGGVPVKLEHYTTLPIQGLDLGFIIPVAILSGILLIKRNPFGYLLATVITIKETAMLVAITAMIVMQAMQGVPLDLVEVMVFAVFDLVIIACLVFIMKNITEPEA